jgi:16S rRNA (guanine527-N7)-methyltransferase
MKNRLLEGLRSWNLTCDSDQADDLIVYLNELLHWNKKINLTAITEPSEALEKHLIDSLLLLRYIKRGDFIVDLGSGAGLPAIPLAITRKDLDIVSVDSVGKKINFQKHIKRKLKLSGIKPLNARVETLAEAEEYINNFDIVTARAFTSLLDIATVAAPLLNNKGRILAMKGAEGEKELAAAAGGLREAGFTGMYVDTYQLPFSKAVRTIIVIEK